MSLFKKFLMVKNSLGLAVIGFLFAAIGGMIVFKGASDGSLMPFVFMLIGIACMVIGIMQAVKGLKTPVEEQKQYNKIAADVVPEQTFDKDAYLADEEEDFVFHYTGKGNQSYVMKDANGTPVYEAITDKVVTFPARPFDFRNLMTGEEETKKIGAPVTKSVGLDSFAGINLSSTFKVDDVDVWELIASKGYGFSFSMHGIACHYDVKRYNIPAGYAELGGTGLMDEKYKNNPLGKIPTNGIFKVRCRRCDVPGLFLICFALSHTELTMD